MRTWWGAPTSLTDSKPQWDHTWEPNGIPARSHANLDWLIDVIAISTVLLRKRVSRFLPPWAFCLFCFSFLLTHTIVSWGWQVAKSVYLSVYYGSLQRLLIFGLRLCKAFFANFEEITVPKVVCSVCSHVHALVQMWRSEDSVRQLVHYFHRVGSRNAV